MSLTFGRLVAAVLGFMSLPLMSTSPSLTRHHGETPWILSDQKHAHAFDTTGVFASSAGATVTLRATRVDTTLVSNVYKMIDADSMHAMRVRLSGSIRSHDVGRSASLWLRVDAGTTMLLLDNGIDRALKGTQDWTDFSVEAPVPSTATRLVLGLLMIGGGDMEARNLHLEVVGKLDAKAPMAADAKKLLDAAIEIARSKSVWRDTVTWNKVVPDVRELAAGSRTEEEAYSAIRYLLTRLGDGHSGFLPPVTTQAFKSGGAQNPDVTVRPLAGNVGYINVPFYSGGDSLAINRYAGRVHTALQLQKADASCGWIVDLRQNSGGNMYPMLAGLRPFLGEGTLGYFVAPDSRSPWSATMSAAPRHPRELDALGKAYVAVLTGPRTASSGEIVAISFRERDRTRSFGLPTGGFSTANAMFPLPGGSTLNLTTAIDADRKGNRFGHAIVPDERIETAAGDSTDTAMERAVAWLQQESKCKTNAQ